MVILPYTPADSPYKYDTSEVILPYTPADSPYKYDTSEVNDSTPHGYVTLYSSRLSLQV